MKQLIILATIIMLGMTSIAHADNKKLSPGFSGLLKALKKEDKHFVYGGADVSRRPTLVTHTAIA